MAQSDEIKTELDTATEAAKQAGNRVRDLTAAYCDALLRESGLAGHKVSYHAKRWIGAKKRDEPHYFVVEFATVSMGFLQLGGRMIKNDGTLGSVTRCRGRDQLTDHGPYTEPEIVIDA